MRITRKSLVTNMAHTLDLPGTPEQMAAYENGALLQEAFPDLPAPEREFIKSGITPDEWRAHVIGAEEEEEALAADLGDTKPAGEDWSVEEAINRIVAQGIAHGLDFDLPQFLPRWQQDGDKWKLIAGTRTVAMIIPNEDAKFPRVKWLSLIAPEFDTHPSSWHGVDFETLEMAKHDIEQWWQHFSREEFYQPAEDES